MRWAALVPFPWAALPAWGSKHSTSWLFPPSAPGKLSQMSATAQLATERLSKAADTFSFSVFSVLFEFSTKVFLGFQVPWWLWPRRRWLAGKGSGS